VVVPGPVVGVVGVVGFAGVGGFITDGSIAGVEPAGGVVLVIAGGMTAVFAGDVMLVGGVAAAVGATGFAGVETAGAPALGAAVDDVISGVALPAQPTLKPIKHSTLMLLLSGLCVCNS
jgi:hypothetical protein